jgi:EmrB/QacA subfamily drug resistance transporter
MVLPMTEDRDDAHAKRTLRIASLAIFAVFLDTTALFVAFPSIVETYESATPAQLSWILNAYTITVAALLIPAGKIADRIGHKRGFLMGTTVFTIGSVLCALAPSAAMLVVFRIVQAAGAAILTPSSLALILRAFPPAKIPAAIAVWGASGAAAGALGPTLAAGIIELADWRWVFLINLPIGVATLVFGRRHLRESRSQHVTMPAARGVVLIAASASILALSLVEGAGWGWTSGRTVITFALGLALLAVFVVDQQRTIAPVLDLEMFRSRNFRWGNIAAVAFGIAFSAMFLGSILFLTQIWGWSILGAGFGVAPGPLIVVVTAPRIGRLAARIGQRPLLLIGGLLFAAGAAFRILLLDADPNYFVDYLPPMLLTGVGVAICIPQLSSVVAQSLPPTRFGVGSAVHQAMRAFAGSIGVALTIGFIGRPASLQEGLESFDRVWMLMLVGGLATSALSLPLVTRRATSPSREPATSRQDSR